MMFLVTGPSGSGKTRFCAERLASFGGGAAGILCPGDEEGGERIRIRARILPSGEERVLARRRAPGEEGLTTPRWSFDAGAVAWGDAHLAAIERTHLLVIDELGPLEFERNEGFVSALPLIDRGDFAIALVVVRPGLISLAKERWPHALVHDVSVGMEPPW